LWAADASIADDELDTLVLDVDRFLVRSLIPGSGVAQIERRDYAEEGYRVIADFLRFNRGRSGDPREHPPPLLILDANARDGGEQGSPSLWVPRGALMTYLRSSGRRPPTATFARCSKRRAAAGSTFSAASREARTVRSPASG
jgi:hypothetical protein